MRGYFVWSLLDNFEWARATQALRHRPRRLRRPRAHARSAARTGTGIHITFQKESLNSKRRSPAPLSRRYFPGGATAVDRVDLAVDDGELLAPASVTPGSGKSTALRMVAGLEEFTVDGIRDRRTRDVNDVRRPRHRHGLPELRAVPAYQRTRTWASGSRWRGFEGGRSPTRVRRPRRGWVSATRTAPAARALGRAAAARRAGPRDRARGAGVPDGRAALDLDAELRVEDAREYRPAEHELGRRRSSDPRPGRGDDDGRPRPASRDGRLDQVDTRRWLYDRPAEPLRRGLHQLCPGSTCCAGVADDDGVAAGLARGCRCGTSHRGDVIVGIRPEAMEPARRWTASVLTLPRRAERDARLRRAAAPRGARRRRC